MKNLYENLGIEKTDDQVKIKKAYRDKSKIHHPDKGGAAEEFQLITTSYKILSDAEKKVQYDSGATVDDILKQSQNKENKVISMLGRLFMSIVSQANIEQQNIIHLMREQLNQASGQISEAIKNLESEKKKFEKVIGRLKISSEKNILKDMALSHIVAIDAKILLIRKEKEDIKEALILLENFSYETDFVEAGRMFFPFSTGCTTF